MSRLSIISGAIHLMSVSLLPLDQEGSVVVVVEVIPVIVMFPDLARSRYWITPTLPFNILLMTFDI